METNFTQWIPLWIVLTIKVIFLPQYFYLLYGPFYSGGVLAQGRSDLLIRPKRRDSKIQSKATKLAKNDQTQQLKQNLSFCGMYLMLDHLDVFL